MQTTTRMGTSETTSEVASRTEDAFNDILTEGGARALFFHLRSEYGVSSADIVNRPTDFKQALASILGDYGSALLIHRVTQSTATSAV